VLFRSGTALLESVRAALAESAKLSSQVEATLSAATRLASLTERERDVMLLAIQGLANKEIARRLDISHRTVEVHKARIMQKTGAETLVDLAKLAEAGGLGA
jgi:FixJ family two-component response regulator